MARRYFGTDGIRGRAGTSLTPELALRAAYGLARCITRGAHYRAAQHRPEVIVGRDCRLSSPMLSAAVMAGLNLGGCDAIELGIVPTPVVTTMILKRNSSAGVMITASHNPIADNGIKFFDASGYKLEDKLEAQIEAVIEQAGTIQVPGETQYGQNYSSDPSLDYLNALKAAVPPRKSPSKLKIILDCAHGATCRWAPDAFDRAGYAIDAIHYWPDGNLINVNCGATSLTHLSQVVLEKGADLGLAFDGDGDRVLAVDHTGQAVSGDKIIALFATRLPRYQRQGAVVMTQMTNIGVEEALARHKVSMVRTEVGDIKVRQAMQQHALNLGGEQSGHIIMLDKSRAGDGILAGLQLVAILANAHKPLHDLVAAFPEHPQQLTNLIVKDKDAWQRDAALKRELKQAQARFKGVRFYLRPSGTENLVRVLTEARDAEICRESNAAICELLVAWDRPAR